jgi:predicted alpha/beta-hydrolase family hydrolase
MKPYVDGFKRRKLDAVAIDLPRNSAERAVEVFKARAGRDVVAGGQSYGGRMASMAAVEAHFAGLILFSYPLHRPGFPDQLRTKHFAEITCPVLFMSGDHDPFARIDLLKKWVKVVPDARLEIFPGQGHGLLPVLDKALDVAAEFIKAIR